MMTRSSLKSRSLANGPTDQRHSKHFKAITNAKECWKNSTTVVLNVDMLQVGKL